MTTTSSDRTLPGSGVPPATGPAALLPPGERPLPPGPVAASLAHGWRAVLRIRHIPEQLIDATAFPIMMTLMYTYLFGGAISGSAERYIQYVLPGMMAMSVLLTSAGTGTALNADIERGVFDRFRTLPVWRPAALVGMILGDLVRYAMASAAILAVGLVLGFRPEGGVPGVLAGVALLVAFAFAFSWIWTMFGLLLRSPASVTSVSMLLFPLTFLSNAFVDPATMPGWLRVVVEINPVTHLIAAIRGLMAGDWSSGETVWVLLSGALITAVFGTLTMWLYNRD
ncbi:ABC transporter permease [Planomonospora corallina]|uniref:Transport permease protein n=1 Tax=Planomonospora corallina TaxID=1806052 RepID=A0ABV8I6Q0_9ACTN